MDIPFYCFSDTTASQFSFSAILSIFFYVSASSSESPGVNFKKRLLGKNEEKVDIFDAAARNVLFRDTSYL